ncbi:MAG: SDR family NAD(P)-dependent oxidoreductase [Planctomycetota bacterium]|jgi:NAD(P)-dependent dehydrogenase (short-subunit alcohol dehydrogenase family)
MELREVVAVITGASGGLGSYLAKALAEAGCKCICQYNRNRQKAEKLVDEIQALGATAVAVQADFCKPGRIKKLFDSVSDVGVPRVLINSAAVFSRQPLPELTWEQAGRVLDLNLVAPIFASRAFAEKINAEFAGSESVVGKIINIADISGIRPWAGYVIYCASKAGLIGATKALAKELAPKICVNSIAPGLVTWPENFDQAQRQRQLSFVPAARIAQPEEIAQTAIFLLKNDYITGQVINVDGGRCI